MCVCVQVPIRFRTKRELAYQPKEFELHFIGNEEVVKIFELENKLRLYFRTTGSLTRDDFVPPHSKGIWSCLETLLVVKNGVPVLLQSSR